MSYMATNDQIMQGGKLMVKRFQRSNQVSFSPHWPWPGLLIFEKLTPRIGDWIWKAPFAHLASGVGDFM